MAATSPQGPSRRWTPVDLAAGLAVLAAFGGLLWSPKLAASVAKATGALVPVEVSVDVRGIPVVNPEALLASARQEGQVAIVIRNQPHGNVRLAAVELLQRRLVAVQPNGSVVTAADPNQAVFSTLDARFRLRGEGRRTGGGVVFGNQNLKVGAPVELEGKSYRVNGTVTGITIERG